VCLPEIGNIIKSSHKNDIKVSENMSVSSITKPCWKICEISEFNCSIDKITNEKIK
jgi:hypothetical protein